MQGLAYIAAYLVIFVPVIVSMLDNSGVFYVFFACIFPLQGTLNSAVYFRPKYVAARNRHDGRRVPRIEAIFEVLDITSQTSLASRANTGASTRQSNDLVGSGTAPNVEENGDPGEVNSNQYSIRVVNKSKN